MTASASRTSVPPAAARPMADNRSPIPNPAPNRFAPISGRLSSGRFSGPSHSLLLRPRLRYVVSPTLRTRDILTSNATGTIGASIMDHAYNVESSQTWSGGRRWLHGSRLRCLARQCDSHRAVGRAVYRQSGRRQDVEPRRHLASGIPLAVLATIAPARPSTTPYVRHSSPNV